MTQPHGYVARLLAATACSGDGRPIGRVAALYVDVATARPTWVSILVDGAGPERLAPLARAWLHPGLQLLMAVTRSAVASAPVAPDGDLGARGEDDLDRYYAPLIARPSRAPRPAAPLDGAAPDAGGAAPVLLRRVVDRHG